MDKSRYLDGTDLGSKDKNGDGVQYGVLEQIVVEVKVKVKVTSHIWKDSRYNDAETGEWFF